MRRTRSTKAKEVLNNFVATLFKANPSLEERKPLIVNCQSKLKE